MKKAVLVGLTLAVMGLIGLLAQPSRSAGPPFSDATLSGTYAISLYVSQTGDVRVTAMFGGNGIVTGTGHQNLASFPTGTVLSCNFTFSGTYSVGSDGSFTMITTNTPGNDCVGSTSHSFVGAVDHSGKSLVLVAEPVNTTTNGPASGTGILQ